jgi:hypothetical protein
VLVEDNSLHHRCLRGKSLHDRRLHGKLATGAEPVRLAEGRDGLAMGPAERSILRPCGRGAAINPEENNNQGIVNMSRMLGPTFLMAVLALVLVIIGYTRGEQQHLTGLKAAMAMTAQVLPLLVCAFIVAGMIQVMLPGETVARWVGAESGIRGILVGTVAGGLAPGGPYVSLPIAAGLLRSGAGIGTMVAFLTGWSLWAVSRLPMEVGILGWKVTLARLACTFFFPPIAGLLAQALFEGTRH